MLRVLGNQVCGPVFIFPILAFEVGEDQANCPILRRVPADIFLVVLDLFEILFLFKAFNLIHWTEPGVLLNQSLEFFLLVQQVFGCRGDNGFVINHQFPLTYNVIRYLGRCFWRVVTAEWGLS